MGRPLTLILCRLGTTSGFSSDSIPPRGEETGMGTGHVVGVASHEYHGADTNGAKHGDRAPWLQYDCGRRGGLGPTSLGSTSPTAGQDRPACPTGCPGQAWGPKKTKITKRTQFKSSRH